MPEHLPGKGLLGWLGRQFGHVRKAVRMDVTAGPKVVYRRRDVRQAAPANRPDVKFRRTVIDEVIVDGKPQKAAPPPSGDGSQ